VQGCGEVGDHDVVDQEEEDDVGPCDGQSFVPEIEGFSWVQVYQLAACHPADPPRVLWSPAVWPPSADPADVDV